jgi:hypothetical protein
MGNGSEVGLLTYTVRDADVEVVTLDIERAGQGSTSRAVKSSIPTVDEAASPSRVNSSSSWYSNPDVHLPDKHPAGTPVVVVTHRPLPEGAAERFPLTTFTGGVEEAIAAAKEIAGDKCVTIASADIIQPALNLGLVDELCMSRVPVPFGTGIRCFGELVGGHVMLEDPVVVQSGRALHLRYPVPRPLDPD